MGAKGKLCGTVVDTCFAVYGEAYGEVYEGEDVVEPECRFAFVAIRFLAEGDGSKEDELFEAAE